MAIHDDTHDTCFYPVRAAGPCALHSGSTMGAFGRSFNPAGPLALDAQGLGGGISFTFTVQVSPATANSAQGLAPLLDLEWQVAQ
jgi:hypothetical protein